MGESQFAGVPIEGGDIRCGGNAADPRGTAIPLECKSFVTPYAPTDVVRVAERSGCGGVATLSCAPKEASRVGGITTHETAAVSVLNAVRQSEPEIPDGRDISRRRATLEPCQDAAPIGLCYPRYHATSSLRPGEMGRSVYIRQAMRTRTKSARVVLVLVIALVLTPLVGRAILEVLQGGSGGTYKNFKGMQIYWSSVLVLAGVAVLALLVGLALRWWHRR
jgi:hypothetical protein